ncbi:DUF4304 domain-containing protein [Novosphingobium sp. EMRT-2]|uniref:DUF4304 domain-containing protein n=1 Tax=Novosphingobium sp. EMRT-2 TaxID=2571749 RepID=UPI0010BD8685|nr:DUF4304 domain-containing protein [Novosphingobium sp. EMRT-2]QCI95965.1 hypothetical protein FA702_20265 [Novosphingobium sp. EMRT-2]
MDSKAVNKEIRARIWPLLKDIGFSRFTPRTAWRYRGDKIDVLNFQSFNSYNASVLGITSFSFCVNLGSYLNYVPSKWPVKVKDGQPIPNEAECHFRRRLMRSVTSLGKEHADIWNVDEQGRNLLWCIQDVAEQLPDVEAWFDRLADKSEVLAILLNQDEDMNVLWGFGRNPSPSRSYLAGYVALAAGRLDLARMKLEEAVQSNCFKEQFGDVDSAIRRAI